MSGFIVKPWTNPASGAAFAPDDISGQVQWVDFSDVSTLFQDNSLSTAVSSDGDPIGGVNDKSANNIDLQNADNTYRLTYKTSIINSLSVGRGDGIEDYLFGTVSASALSAVSVYGVFRTGSSVAVTTAGLWSWANSITSGTPYILIQLNSSALRVYVNSGYQFSVSVSANTAYQVCVRYTGTAWKCRVNGVDETDYTGGDSNKSTASNIYYNTGFNGRSDVDQGEWIVYDSYLSGTDDTNVEAYLQDKWAAYV